jgi:serine/threonine-protein kinase
MGVVYKAVDTRLDRIVAIKVLAQRAADDPHARERFDREGRAIAALNDPHICALYDIGETTVDGGDPGSGATEAVRFLVMEYLEGETLASRLRGGPLPLPEALRYAEHIALALERAHGAGIVHRDLKPGNIFLVPGAEPSAPSTAKLLDFGVAKTARPATDGDVTKTRARDLTTLGTMIGTVQYMAPEQIEGGETDARTDIFAFGMILFEMLTGRRTFEGRTEASLLGAILEREPLRVSALQPLAPPWIDELVQRCLAKEPADRWPSASDVRRELQSSGQSTTATRVAAIPARPAAIWLRPAVIAGVVAAVALASVVLTGVWRRWSAVATPAVRQAALAVLPLRAVDSPDVEAAHLGVGIADAILTKLANVHSIRVRPTSAIAAFEGRTVDPVAASQQLQVDHVLTGTVRRVGDAYRFNLQLIRGTDGVLVWGRQIDVSRRDLLGVEDQVTTEVVGALQLEISSGERAQLSQRYTQNPDAYDEYLTGRALLANYSDSNMRQAIDHFERALQIDPNYVLADAGMATAAGISSVRFAYDLRHATDWGRRAEEYAGRASRQNTDLGEVHLALASAAGTLYRNFDWPTVIREAEAALARNPSLDLAHSALARAFYHIGQLDWSELESTRAEETSGGTGNIEVARVHLYNKFLSGRFDEARAMAEALLARTDAAVIRQYHGLSIFYGGDHAKGEQVLAAVRHPDGRIDQRSQASLAGVLAANGKRDDAAAAIRGVLDSGYMDHHVAYGLGVASAQLGRPSDAVRWLQSAADTGFPCYPWVARDPLLDPVRRDPAFQAFLAGLRTDYDRARTRYESGSRRP